MTTVQLILYWSGFGLLWLGLLLSGFINRSLRKELDRALDHSIRLNDECLRASFCKLDREIALADEALVEERTDIPFPCFAVYRRGELEKHDIARLHYNPSEPEHRVAMARKAHDIADAINSKI